MSAPRAMVEDQLNALIDDRLDPAERAAVLAVLARSAELTARVKALRRQQEALRGVGQEILHEPVPERLRSVLARTGSTARGGGSVGPCATTAGARRCSCSVARPAASGNPAAGRRERSCLPARPCRR